MSKINSWIYALRNKEKITIACEESDEIESIVLEKEGIIQLEYGCSANMDGTKLKTKKGLLSSYILKRIPPVIPLVNITEANLTSYTLNYTKGILRLEDTISISKAIDTAKIQENIKLRDVSRGFTMPTFHDWISYGSTTSIIIVIIGYFMYKKIKNQRNLPVTSTIIVDRPAAVSTSVPSSSPSFMIPKDL